MNQIKLKSSSTLPVGLNGSSRTTKDRCKEEIARWVGHVVSQVEIVGKEMMEEVEVQLNFLVEPEEDVTVSKVGCVPGRGVKFVPNAMFDELKKTDLGFLAYGDIVPSDFHLDLVTLLPSVKVGSIITFSLSCDKQVSQSITRLLQLSVTCENTPVSLQTSASSPLQFSFPLRSPGQYQVTAQLYGQHLPGSPLTVPVAVSALPGLAQLGLGPLEAGLVVKEEVKSLLSCVEAEGGTDKAGKLGDKKIVSGLKLIIGLNCIAKWSEDGVWYNARVEKVEERMVEVTFIDYGNVEMVCIENMIKSKAEVPAGEEIDENVVDDEQVHIQTVEISQGDLVVAKWQEDNVWYNAKIGKCTIDSVEVEFVDYGNSDTVQRKDIVKDRKCVPEGEEVDENVGAVNTVVSNVDVSPIKVTEEVEVIEPKFVAGDVMVAKWGEDKVWYNAKIEKVCKDTVEVVFVDYGNEDIVQRGDIVKDRNNVPDGEEVDENVVRVAKIVNNLVLSPIKEIEEIDRGLKFGAGEHVVAKWDEDDVWYNAQVEEAVNEGYSVIFTDYGNAAIVKFDRVVKEATEVSANEILDECVTMVLTYIKLPNLPTEVSPQTFIPSWDVGDFCVARWSDDKVWYNALVDSVSGDQYQVNFTDYGNADIVTNGAIVAAAEDIPADEHDMVDECVIMPAHNTNVEVVVNEEKVDCVTDHKTATRTDLSTTVSTEKGQSSGNTLIIDSTTPTSKFLVGAQVIAKWDEDDVWYNAKIEDVVVDGYSVVFTDYGNSAVVKYDQVVSEASQIDANETLDECVIVAVDRVEASNPVASALPVSDLSWAARDICIARWSDDQVWYNAKVDSVSGDNYQVTFTDYGNTDTVTSAAIVANASDIPTDELDMVDELVNLPESSCAEHNTAKMDHDGEDIVAPTPVVVAAPQANVQHGWTVGDICVARWSEDCTWYNAQVERIGTDGILVRFTDYDNEDLVKEEYLVKCGKDIPKGNDIDQCVMTVMETVPNSPPGVQLDCEVPPCLACSLCGQLCKRGMRLACGPAVACWGCAVKQINTHRSCWLCGEKQISTETHLVQDSVLRAFVDQYLATGKLDPAHVQALKNGSLQPMDNVDTAIPPIKKEEEMSSTSYVKSFQHGDVCIARWSEDSVWYNAIIEEITSDGQAVVLFSDYGNTEHVSTDLLLTNPADLPNDAEVDPHVKTDLSALVPCQPSLDLLSLTSTGPAGLQLTARHSLVIPHLPGPVGLTLLGDCLVVACRGDNSVRRFDKVGQFLGMVSGKRDFVRPVDILGLSNGNFVVGDELGIQMFDMQGKFIRNLGEEKINRCFGLAEDELGRVMTINFNSGVAGGGDLTDVGQTDVFYIAQESGAVVRRVEMIDIVEEEEKDKSACRFLSYYMEKLYVVDMGKDCVYVLFLKDGKEHAELFGSSGCQPGQFKDPAGLVVDGSGNMIVVDSKNNRLQLVHTNYTDCGIVKVDRLLSRPSGLFLDQKRRTLIVSNYGDQSVVFYTL